MRMPAEMAAVAAIAAALVGGLLQCSPSTASVTTTVSAGNTARHVAITVSGHGAYCVAWHAGITGDDVLNAVARVHYRSDGLIDQIDGAPNPPHADDTHYWSYWHDTGTRWAWSHFGASGYSPARGAVEGWSYDNGASPARPPSAAPNGLYARICGRYDQPSSTTSRRPSSTPSTATSTRSTAAASAHPVPAAGRVTRSSPHGTAARRVVGRASGPNRSTSSARRAVTTATRAASPSPRRPAAKSTAARSTARVDARSSGSSAGPSASGQPAVGQASAGPSASGQASAGPSASGQASVGPSASGQAAPGPSVASSPVAAATGSSGSPASAVLALAVVALVAVSAGATVARRRRANTDG